MTKKELLGKELSNLYAIAKQVNTYFNGSDISFLTERSQVVLADYVQFSCGSEGDTSETLKAIQVNPGNTTDSIVNEITENLEAIVKSNLGNPMKELSYQLSLNRLMAYHTANIENVSSLKAMIDSGEKIA
ncbi:hypothetical protein FGM00_13005 [Aggregatimonas sangjinii]|uniref:Uncharacterized protein n=1 Tax=Aggregatimonas sangjinii TaxID=2583587 RepID=A0A5B7SQT9_9FLAO|nr:hypothetical protein [Aggregatimonas sangjinii]QCX00986.1 hypothetical protein FGM00_13005 [Aggregatimonas sangjinii]